MKEYIKTNCGYLETFEDVSILTKIKNIKNKLKP